MQCHYWVVTTLDLPDTWYMEKLKQMITLLAYCLSDCSVLEQTKAIIIHHSSYELLNTLCSGIYI